MKKVIEKTRPAHVLGVRQESPEKRTGVFIESIMVKWSLKLQWVCMGRGRV